MNTKTYEDELEYNYYVRLNPSLLCLPSSEIQRSHDQVVLLSELSNMPQHAALSL